MIFIWVIGIIISIPFLFAVEYTVSPVQCQLNINLTFLIYVLSLNTLLIFVPTIGLLFLYLFMIISLRKASESRLLYSDQIIEKANERSIRSSLSYSITSSNRNFKSFKFKQINQNNILEDETLKEDNGNLIEKCPNKNEPNRKKSVVIFETPTESVKSIYNIKNISDQIIECKSIASRSSIVSKSNHHNSFSIKNKINYTTVISLITLFFFFCQLPVRIFLSWSYLNVYFNLLSVDSTNDDDLAMQEKFRRINLISNFASLIYFFHSISNPIIYNISSTKFRNAFTSITKFKRNSTF